MARKQKEARPLGRIYAFDIETNQYYNYESWRNVNSVSLDANDKEIVDGEKIFEYIKAEIGESIKSLPVSNLDGSKRVSDVYAAVCNKIFENNPDAKMYGKRDAVQMIVTAFISKYFPHTAQKTEVYIATFVEIPVEKTEIVNGVEKSVKWHEHSAEEFKTIVQNAPATVCTSMREINKMFKYIYDEGSDMPNIVLIHNLSYEMNNCIRNLPFFQNLVNKGCVTYLSNNAANTFKSMQWTSVPKKTKTGETSRPNNHVYIRDTWKLTSLSIKNVGKAHGYPKLPYEYGIIRDSKKLTEEDYKYNRRDCEISLLAFYDAWVQFPDELDRRFEEKGTIPVSANSITSTVDKMRFEKEYNYHRERVSPKSDKNCYSHSAVSYLPHSIYKAFRKTTGGGLVFVNPFFAYNQFTVGKRYETINDTFAVKEIKHIDLVSAHPSQAFKRFFPAQTPVSIPEKYNEHIKTALKNCFSDIKQMITADGIEKNLDCFEILTKRLDIKKKSNSNMGTSGFAEFTFTNLRCKSFKIGKADNYNLPCLWSSKIATKVSGAVTFDENEYESYEGENLLLCGSKIVCADSVKMNLTFEDFLTAVCLFYDFDDFSLNNIHLYSMAPISAYLYNRFSAGGEKKNVYKSINKALDAGDTARALTLAEHCKHVLAVHNSLLKELNSRPTAEKIADMKTLSDSWLSAAKGQFNGVYGSSMQSLERDNSTIQVVNGEIEWVSNPAKYDDENAGGIDYMQGAYIAQWSRVDIALYTRFLADNGCIPLYIATDSVYYLVTEHSVPNVSKVLGIGLKGERYCEMAFNKPTPALVRNRPNTPQIGGMDDENPINSIGYTQALKIVYEEEKLDKKTGEIKLETKITFSGATAVDEVIDDDNNEIAVGFFSECTDFDSVVTRLFQEEGFYSRFDIMAKNKKTSGEANTEGSYLLESQDFINNSPKDEKYICRKIYSELLEIHEI